jgi:hypothetical protein
MGKPTQFCAELGRSQPDRSPIRETAFNSWTAWIQVVLAALLIVATLSGRTQGLGQVLFGKCTEVYHSCASSLFVLDGMVLLLAFAAKSVHLQPKTDSSNELVPT